MGAMRIAHFSDLHLLDLEGIPLRRFLNKRLTGYANLRLKRNRVHRASYVRAIAQEVASQGFDHVVITGDLTNLALESEYALAKEVIEHDLGLDPSHVTLVPGNHDLYTRGAQRTRRFFAYFGDYLKSDLPDLTTELATGAFPVVKLRGPAAFIALSSAVASLPLLAFGSLGQPQLEALSKVLQHPEVTCRTPVFALHHPALNPKSRLVTLLGGLRDAAHLQTALEQVSRGLVLHGHLHHRGVGHLVTQRGTLHVVGATSASLHHEKPSHMAGFNVYRMEQDGVLGAMEAHVYNPGDHRFHTVSLPG